MINAGTLRSCAEDEITFVGTVRRRDSVSDKWCKCNAVGLSRMLSVFRGGGSVAEGLAC